MVGNMGNMGYRDFIGAIFPHFLAIRTSKINDLEALNLNLCSL